MKIINKNILVVLFSVLIMVIFNFSVWGQECQEISDNSERFKCKSDKYNELYQVGRLCRLPGNPTMPRRKVK